MTLLAGTRLGPYEIVAPLGAGGMGEVYRARDARLGRDVAAKVLPAAFSTDPDRMRRFEQEARAAAALNHPNILAIYDIGTHEGSPYVVSELLDGTTLRERLSGGALPQRKTVEYALDIARGLAAAHAKGIVHRDLKPENLFLTRDGRIKILDFGLAKLTRPDPKSAGQSKAPTLAVDTDPGMILGTVGYMAPEQVRGEAADHRADLFALGAILHEMLTGKRPFQRPTPIETMNAILNSDPPDLSGAPRPVSPAFERIVGHCLEKDPGARFQSAQDVAFNLEALSGLSEPGSGLAPAARSRRRFPRWAAAAAALGGLALLLGAFAAGRAIQSGQASKKVPRYTKLTYRKGVIYNARFAPDGQTFLYAASWDGAPLELYMGRFGTADSRELGRPRANLLSVSSSGEMALSLGARRESHLFTEGTLARASLGGEAPREVLAEVYGADWSPDGSSLAVIHLVERVFRLEYPIGKVLYKTNGWMKDIRISPKGDLVAFLDHPVFPDDRGSVVVVDPEGKRRVLSEGWSTAQGLAWSPDGREVWFTAGTGINSRALHAVTLSGKQRLIARAPGGITLLDISRDGRVLLMTDDERADLYGLLPGETKERNLTWHDFSVPADISSDGKTVLFTEQGEAAGSLYSVYMRGIDGSPATRLGEGQALSFSPDGKSALAVLYGNPAKLVILPTGAGEARVLPSAGPRPFGEGGAAWTADGKNILFVGEEPDKGPRGYIQNIESGAIRPVTPEGVFVFIASPRGDTLYASPTEGKAFAYPTGGGAPRQMSLEGTGPRDRFIRVAPDGRTIHVFEVEDPYAKLYRMDGYTRRKTLVRELKPSEQAGLLGVPAVTVSPDGRSVAFMGRRYMSQLFVAEGLR